MSPRKQASIKVTEDSGKFLSHWRHSSRSVIHEDPLDIGVPLPVLVSDTEDEQVRPKTTGTLEEIRSDQKEIARTAVKQETRSEGARGEGANPVRTSLPSLNRRSNNPRPHARPGAFAVQGLRASFGVDTSVSTRTSRSNTVYDEENQRRRDCQEELFEATLVTDTEDKNVVQGEAVTMLCPWLATKRGMSCVALLLTVIVGLALGLALLKEGRTETVVLPTAAPASQDHGPDLIPRTPTLQRVRQEGILRCGTGGDLRALFKHIEETLALQNGTVYENEDTDLPMPQLSNNLAENICNALAAAVLGPNKAAVELVRTQDGNKYQLLANRSIDVLFQRDSMSMEQDVYQDIVGDGLSYSIPYLYSGLSFLGDPFYVRECAEQNINTHGNCSGMMICINQEMRFTEELVLLVPKRQVYVANTSADLFEKMIQGTCNVMVSQGSTMTAAHLRASGYEGRIAIGTRQYSNEIFAVNTVDHDPVWQDFVNTVLMALLAAEQVGITKENATLEAIGETDLFGEDYRMMLVHAIQKGGNFGEVFDFPVVRNGRNDVNTGTSGLIASQPLGDLEHLHEHHFPAGTTEAVRTRGILRCGVRGDRPGFAHFKTDPSTNQSRWEGMDVDHCLALTASLFDGDQDKIEFHDISQVNDTRSENGFTMLSQDIIDVFAGAMWTIENDMREPLTQVGYSFSLPYFYGPSSNRSGFDENLCLATRQDDPRWSSFVYWIAQSLVYAEERGIGQAEASQEMPLVNIFGGPNLDRILRDSVHAVGNYGALYERHIEEMLPREGGRNMLNKLEDGSPLRYIPPGFSFM